MYTGEAGSGPRNLDVLQSKQQWQLHPSGPNMVDYHRLLTGAQGTMGIVTWMSLRCTIVSDIHHMHFVSGGTSDDMIEFMYRVLHCRFADELLMINKATLSSLLEGTHGDIQTLRSKLPEWIGLVGIAGRPPLHELRVRGQEADIANFASQLGLKMEEILCGIRGENVLDKISNPCDVGHWKDNWKGASADIFFVTTMDRALTFIDRVYQIVCESGYATEDLGVYLQPQHQGVNCHLEFSFPYNPGNQDEAEMVEALFDKASKACADMGAFYSRPYGKWSSLQLNKDAKSAEMLKTLKSIFDPNGIMNPGKLGTF